MMKGSFESWPETISEGSILQISNCLGVILHPDLWFCKAYT